MNNQFKKIVSYITLFIYMFGLGAQAQIIADPNANKNQRPHVINGSNGTPIVNIQTPTQGGISVNHYQQFDVDQKGVILNNSRQPVNTQLGGMVQGNDWLATGSAKAIVNQINSQNSSQLNGFIEVAGQKADVIIANPSGININGSGFINAGKVTITTGTPIIQGGQLQRFEIRGGAINIMGNGLNNDGVDYTQILSEVVNIQAGVWAKDLEVIAGNFDLDMKGEITKYAKKDSKAKVAIDTGALGGMYAGKIKLVSTDKGVGVNHAGQAFATVNGFSLSADGKLTNTGTIVAQNKSDNKAAKVTIKAQSIENKGSISSQGQQKLKATEITNHGLIVSSHELIINNGTTLTNTDQAEMRGARLEITSNRLINSGKITQTGSQDLQVEATQLENTQGGKIGYIVEKTSGSTSPTEEIEITPPTGSTGSAGGSVIVDSTPSNSQPIQWATGTIIVEDALQNNGGTLSANGGVSLEINHALKNDHSELYLNNLSVTGDVLSNVQGKIIANTANLIIQQFNNQQGSLVTDKTAQILAEYIGNQSGKIASVGVLTLSHQGANDLVIDNHKGEIIADQVNIFAHKIYNQQGQLLAEKNNQISATYIDNQTGKIASAGNLSLKHQDSQDLLINNKNGEILAEQTLNINAGSLTGDGAISSVHNITIALKESFTNYKNIVAGDNVVISTLKDFINHADLQAGQSLEINSHNFDNTKTGNLASGQKIELSIDKNLTNRGTINSGLTQITTKNLENIGTGKIYGDIISINASNILNLNETVNGQTAAAVIGAREHLALGAKNILNKDESLLLSGNTLMIGGSVDQNHQTVGNAETLYNRSARIEALGDAKIAVERLWNLNDYFQKDWIPNPVEQKHIPASFTWQPGGGISQYHGSQEFIDALLSGQEMEFTRNCGDGSGKFCTDYNKGMMAYAIWDDKGNYARGDSWLLKGHTISKYEETIINSKPAEIIIGGNLIAEGEHWINSDSQIIVGKDLIANDLVKLDNLETLKETYTRDQGAMTIYTPANGQNTITESASYPIDQKSPITKEHFDNSPILFRQNVSLTQDDLSNQGKGNLQIDVDNVNNGIIKTLVNYNQSLPTSSLFTINPNGQQYLIETDPRFTNYKKWLGSDYMLKILSTNPENMHKRLGDGYYEQRLINDQINQLTGYRRLGGYQSDEDQYKALMNAGVTIAGQLNLTVGIALTADQVARLTSDIVWLETTTVTLPDGRVETVLVPKVYVVAREGDLTPTGALVSANNLKLNLSDDLNNHGTLAGRKIVDIQGQNLNNSGRIIGQNVNLSATDTVNINGGEVIAQDNLWVKGQTVNVVTTTATNGDQNNGYTVVDRVAGLYVTNKDKGTLSVSAENDINIHGANINNAAATGKTQLVSKTGSVNIGTVNVASHESVGDGQNYHREHRTGEVGSSITANNDITILAGQDVNIRQSELNSDKGKIAIHATNDANIVEGRETRDTDVRATYSSKKLLSRKSGVYEGSSQRDDAVGSVITGKDVQITADHDVLIRGSDVISDDSTQIMAKNDLTITTAESTYSEEVNTQNKKSGLMSSGGIGFTIGSVKETLDRDNSDITNTGSTVGSLKGNTILQAGNSYTQKGSTVASPEGDILIKAKDVNIVAAEDTYNSDYRYTRTQKGLTVAINVPIVDAIQSVADSIKTVGKSKNDRVNAMAAANTAWDAKKAVGAVDDIGKALDSNNPNPTNISASITYGQSKSESTSHTEGSKAISSTVNAGGKVVIQATGAGENSNINIVGSDVAGKGGTYLAADNQVNIVAAEQYSQERSQNKSSGWNAGVKITYGSNGFAFGVTAGGNKGKGHGNGDDTTYRYSHVGDLNSQTLIQSGGATNIIGGQVFGKGVKIDADELNIVSLQETSTYDSKQQNISGSVTVGYGFSGSASYNKSKIKSDYKSANELAGIYAGDDGFNINVNNNTNLVGGIITSTEKAEADGKNSFTTGTLTSTDLNNYSNYNASGVGIGAGISVGGSDQPQKDNPITEKIPLMDTGPTGVSKSVGYGKDKGSESSTTNSGIYTSNITITDAEKQKELTGKTVEQTIADIKTDINTDQAMDYQGLNNIFDKDKVQKEIDLQVTVTQTFDKNRQEMKLEINKKIDQAKKEKDPTSQKNWELVGKILDSVSAGLYAPTESIGGSLVAAASPELANQIGQYFKGLKADQKGELTVGQDIAHKLAHGLLGAAVAAATGQDVTNGALAGAGAEILGEQLTKWLYPEVDDPSKLTADQKATISAIVGLGTAGIGLATGNSTTDVATGGMIGQNAVENNQFGNIAESLKLNPTSLSEWQGINANIADCNNGNQLACQEYDKAMKQKYDKGLTDEGKLLVNLITFLPVAGELDALNIVWNGEDLTGETVNRLWGVLGIATLGYGQKARLVDKAGEVIYEVTITGKAAAGHGASYVMKNADGKIIQTVEKGKIIPNKVYSANGDVALRNLRRPQFDEILNNGFPNGMKLNTHAYNSLFKSGRKDIMLDDVIDALKSVPKPAKEGSLEYINSHTGTSVFVNPLSKEVVGIWPSSFKK